jgi:hypothetical protein
MNNRRTLACVIVAACTTLAACVATAPEWDARFGDAARQARALQVIDPAAPARNVTQPRIDSKATAGAQTNYATSYGYAVKEQKPPTLTITTTTGQ